MNADMYLVQLAELEGALNRRSESYADALILAVRDFNAAPISASAVDTFRDRVLAIADRLAQPLRSTGGVNGDAMLSTVTGLRAVRRLDEAQARSNEALKQRRLK